jgi:histidyl-tRNA synthetase
MEKPTLPKGTRDFGPVVMAKRQFIFENIRKVFQKYGFQPLETPAMENLSTLTGKYGEEGDQLLFRILDSGDFLDSHNSFVISNSGSELRELLSAIDQKIGKEKIYSHKNERISELHMIIDELSADITFRNEDFEKELPLRNLVSKYKEAIIDAIIDWYCKAKEAIEAKESKAKANDIIDDVVIWYKYRNSAVSNLISKMLRDRTAEKGLRYDLTVPFARYVVMNRNEVSFPFKRYQIQPVWRADRPQKGRYREFYQCDADVVGTNSLICEAEIILMIKEVFKGLGIEDYSIKINHRGILSGIAEHIKAVNETALFVAIDKLDKIGEDGVRQELLTKGFEDNSITTLFQILGVKGSATNKIAFLAAHLDTSHNGMNGLRDLQEVLNILKSYGATTDHVDFDIALARGLSYYTGCIFEVKINNVAIGSVSGGGRYDNLTQSFGDKENLPGVGFSFGVDRIYDAMEELKLFPKNAQVSSTVLICHFDDESFHYGLGVLTQLRSAGIASEIYPDQAKLKKQLDFANKKGIPYTIVIGSEEVKSGTLPLKDMEKGEQEKLAVDQIISRLQR